MIRRARVCVCGGIEKEEENNGTDTGLLGNNQVHTTTLEIPDSNSESNANTSSMY